MDCSLPDSSVYGIFQARVLEWVAISFSRGSSRPRGWSQVSHTVGRHFTIWDTWELSSLQQSKSVIYIYICVCVYISLLFFRVLFSHIVIIDYWVEFSVLYSRFLFVIYFIYGGVYMSIPNFQFNSFLFSSLIAVSLFSTSVTLLLFC